MPDLPRSHLFVYVLAGVAVVWFGVRLVARPDRGAVAAPVQFAGHAGGSGSGGGAIVVHVAGAVRRPGVYRLHAGARVNDAIRLAGGARHRAELTQVNLAQKLEDGRQVIVPVRTPVAAAGVPTQPGAAAPAGPVNLNTATLEQLDALTGVGPVTAQQILDYREAHGGFGSVEELDQVPGIGEVTMATLRELVTV
ncbi:MAG: competence protein ComEA [Solirubrobacteraceae bacterium]|nr:competence protein ComEA [Solirubrobacteraceae bacterium]